MSNRKSGRRRWDVPPAAVKRARERIEHWRATREKRTHMPESLWHAAAVAARDHGLWAVSHALRVNYEGLTKRLVKTPSPDTSTKASFVELDTSQLVSRSSGAVRSTVIELSSEAGAKMRVRLEGHGAAEVSIVARALLELDR